MKNFKPTPPRTAVATEWTSLRNGKDDDSIYSVRPVPERSRVGQTLSSLWDVT